MGNTIPGAITKLLTLVPILVALYFFDLPKFLATLTSANQGAFFVVAISLFALGLGLKRRILRARLELSRVSVAWGLLLLGGAVVLYIYGSFSTETVWFRYESLFLFFVAYAALRIGTGILRSLAPLLAILVLAFPPVDFFFGLNKQDAAVFLWADLIFILFLTFVGLRVSAVIIPTAIVILGLFAWYEPSLLLFGHRVNSVVFVAAPLLVLLVPRLRALSSLPGSSLAARCPEHHLLPNGFCSICGSRLSSAKLGENVGVWGFLAVVGVAALLILGTVPALAIVGGVPYEAHYTSQGYSGTITPATPAGWQINSTENFKTNPSTSLNFTTDAYAINEVYVPIYHPETENYSLYYELAPVSPPYSNGPFGDYIASWNISSNNLFQFGPFQGHLTAYTRSNTVMLAYEGTTSMLFLNGSTFSQYSVGLGFVRTFKNSNVSSDIAQFTRDLNALWLASFARDSTYSGWTSFLNSLDLGAVAASTLLLLASSVGAMAWGAYRMSLKDERMDRFLSLASAQSEERWPYLSDLLKRPHRSGTGQELGLPVDTSTKGDIERLDSSLRELEERRVVTRSLVERGADIVSVWRTVV